MRRPSGLSIGGTWGQWRSRGGENKIWRIQTLFFPLVWLWCVSKWKWGQCCHHFYFLLFTFFASLLCSSLLWNATDEGAIAPKALVYVQINVKFNLVGSVWWIREELSKVSFPPGWQHTIIKICVWTCDMASRSYFGKMNSTLGSVVPLAMFTFYVSTPTQQ